MHTGVKTFSVPVLRKKYQSIVRVTVILEPDDSTENEIIYEVNAFVCHGYRYIETNLVENTSMFALTQGVDNNSVVLVKLKNEYTKLYVPAELILNVHLDNLSV